MLKAIATINLLRLTPSLVALTLNAKKEMSTITPYSKVKMNEKGRNAGSHKPVSTPPTAPTEVAPALFIKSAPRARRTASTTISNLSIGAGTKTLVTNIIEPKSAVMNSRTIF